MKQVEAAWWRGDVSLLPKFKRHNGYTESRANSSSQLEELSTRDTKCGLEISGDSEDSAYVTGGCKGLWLL